MTRYQRFFIRSRIWLEPAQKARYCFVFKWSFNISTRFDGLSHATNVDHHHLSPIHFNGLLSFGHS
jgi:hypothetical protein